MDAQLRIESDEASRLADELARLTGEDVTTAVIIALREKVDKLLARNEKMAKIRAITADIRAHLSGPVSSNHDWLYDEDGGARLAGVP
ncbi:MAG: type II toxin-antitoxin system VapB family antitoxin [Acetobacteraceae bacterium]